MAVKKSKKINRNFHVRKSDTFKAKNISGITKAGINRLIQKGGCTRISPKIYNAILIFLDNKLKKLTNVATLYTLASSRLVINNSDMNKAIKKTLGYKTYF